MSTSSPKTLNTAASSLILIFKGDVYFSSSGRSEIGLPMYVDPVRVVHPPLDRGDLSSIILDKMSTVPPIIRETISGQKTRDCLLIATKSKSRKAYAQNAVHVHIGVDVKTNCIVCTVQDDVLSTAGRTLPLEASTWSLQIADEIIKCSARQIENSEIQQK